MSGSTDSPVCAHQWPLFSPTTCLRCREEERITSQRAQAAVASKPINIRPGLPTEAQARKNAPIARGVLDYFPNAIAAVAECSRLGNEQHNPGQPMHWAREKSTDHADCIVRHLIDRGTVDVDGVRHATKVAWRALALLQTELEGGNETNRTLEGAKETHARRDDRS